MKNKETPKESAKNNIIEDWLKEHGDPEVDKEVECKLEQITLEEAAEKYSSISFNKQDLYDGFIEGAKWQAKRMHSDEEVEKLLSKIVFEVRSIENNWNGVQIWFQKNKKK